MGLRMLHMGLCSVPCRLIGHRTVSSGSVELCRAPWGSLGFFVVLHKVSSCSIRLSRAPWGSIGFCKAPKTPECSVEPRQDLEGSVWLHAGPWELQGRSMGGHWMVQRRPGVGWVLSQMWRVGSLERVRWVCAHHAFFLPRFCVSSISDTLPRMSFSKNLNDRIQPCQ